MSNPIHQEIIFKASPKRIYEAFMDSEEHSRFTDAPAKINREAGGAFSCHGGVVLGRNIELIPNQRIIQAWRISNWDDGIYSILKLKLELKEQGSETRLIMDHIGVPESEREHIESGWHARYWEPLKKYLV